MISLPNVGTLVAAAASGGRITPAKPVATHTATGQFTLGSGYSADNIYNLSVTAGTVTRNGSVVILSNANSVATITAQSPKGTTASTALTVERRAITFTTTIVDDYQTQDYSCPPGYNFEDYGEQGRYCRLYQSTENSPPAGFTKAHNEWAKIT